MANDVTSVPFSLPLVGYAYTVTALTNVDGTTANALTFTGLPQNFVIHGILVQCISHTTGTPAAAYASINADSIAQTVATGTVTVNAYVKTATGTAATLLVILY